MSTERRAGRAAAPTAAELCAGMRLEDAAQLLLAPSMTPRAYVETLLAAGLHVAAIEVVAHALPRRLGLWWALLCAQHATADRPLAPEQAHLFRLAARWLRDPAEPVRAAAEAAAREAGAASVGGLLGYAVAMHAKAAGADAVANAVKLASVMAPPSEMQEVQRAYAALGLRTRLPEEALGGAFAGQRRSTPALRCV